MRCSNIVDDLHLPSATIKKIKKKLRFDNLVRVTLIPSIAEYKDAGLHIFLWCSQNELQCYKDSAYEDIVEFMRASNCDSFAQAMKALFQVDTCEPSATATSVGAGAGAAPSVALAENVPSIVPSF